MEGLNKVHICGLKHAELLLIVRKQLSLMSQHSLDLGNMCRIHDMQSIL